jgi:hypothetical protein
MLANRFLHILPRNPEKPPVQLTINEIACAP